MTSKTLPQPPARRLKVYAFDPNASLDLGSAKFNQATISLTWSDLNERPLGPGPVNEYFEVIDIDPVSNQFYEPVDLRDPELLAQDGLPPSEGDPRFHQQMTFAVAMKTVRLFERALGRKVLWAPHWDNKKKEYQPTYRLRIYPHALREENAYYSRRQRALLFGYFKATHRDAGATWVFTALSHDIIVHETTHAILDGLHPRYSEATSLDSLAFHEAFADIAALFSHFMLEEAVRHHIATAGGSLDQSSLLSGLAGQFAKGSQGRASLRDYIDPNPKAEYLDNTTEAHERGAILVAAVFDAFLTIYKARTADLLRLANVVPGTTPYLHTDLVERLTQEAVKSADHVLRMCIRALDYLPPIDVHFGDFLRAIVTADADLIANDKMNYRVAFIEAFRRRGIYPQGCISMSPDNLLWPTAELDDDGEPYLRVDDVQNQGVDLLPLFKRSDIFRQAENNRRKLWYWLAEPELRYEPEDGSLTPEQEEAELKKLMVDLQTKITSDEIDTIDEAEKLFENRKKVLRSRELSRRKRKDNRKQLTRTLSVLRAVIVDDKIETEAEMRAFVEMQRKNLEWLGLDEGLYDELARLLQKANEDKKYESWAKLFTIIREAKRLVHDADSDRRWEKALGVYFKLPPGKELASIRRRGDSATIQINSVRSTRRAGPDGENIRQMVIEVTQRRYAFFDSDTQGRCNRGELEIVDDDARLNAAQQKRLTAEPPTLMRERDVDFIFRGGATLIVDLRDNKLRYVIPKAIDDEKRLETQRQILQRPAAHGFTYDRSKGAEPFALLHRH